MVGGRLAWTMPGWATAPESLGSQLFDGKQLVTKESVYLFDGVFGSHASCLRETSSDVRDARSGGSERAEHCVIDRTERLFVKHSVEALGQKALSIGGPKEWMGVHKWSVSSGSFLDWVIVGQ